MPESSRSHHLPGWPPTPGYGNGSHSALHGRNTGTGSRHPRPHTNGGPSPVLALPPPRQNLPSVRLIRISRHRGSWFSTSEHLFLPIGMIYPPLQFASPPSIRPGVYDISHHGGIWSSSTRCHCEVNRTICMSEKKNQGSGGLAGYCSWRVAYRINGHRLKYSGPECRSPGAVDAGAQPAEFQKGSSREAVL